LLTIPRARVTTAVVRACGPVIRRPILPDSGARRRRPHTLRCRRGAGAAVIIMGEVDVVAQIRGTVLAKVIEMFLQNLENTRGLADDLNVN
jgi:hypothetical protein